MASIRGGEKVRAVLRQIGSEVAHPTKLRVGFLENATYPDGKPVAMIAAIQEFGAPRTGIPPRPFFRNMVREKKDEWPAAVAHQIKVHDYNVGAAFEVVGAAIAGQLQQSIINTNSPPLAESTIRRKGFAKPLIDTSHMINSVGFDVKRWGD